MIRTVTPSDLWSLRRKPRYQQVLYTERLLAYSHRPLWFALQSMLAGNHRERMTLVLAERGGFALAQAMGRLGRPEQDVIYLATNGTRSEQTPSDYELWFHLLHRLCADAAQHSVQRLYAALPSQHNELREIFRQVGFQAYTHRQILHLSGPDWDQGTRLAPMRAQSRRDHWAIHKLYGIVAPHLVQQAEVRNARYWTLYQPYSLVRRQAWVLGPDDDLAAYLRLLSGPSGHVFSVLIRPDAREQAVDVLRFGLAQLSDSRPVYLILREYQQELFEPAMRLGFQPVGEQILLVKHTVVPIRRTVLAPSLEVGLEPRVSVRRYAWPPTVREER
ncbi:hypothetical protein [uncultured Chloroflexus sp.]|uniref:hypothetical protein n=1 Tax=uncultured Chloroflexus sp. TaxID=214040 RepID=UPI002619029C|nr:hypothetical protein [uncultured Chloroflexus sp.]